MLFLFCLLCKCQLWSYFCWHFKLLYLLVSHAMGVRVNIPVLTHFKVMLIDINNRYLLLLNCCPFIKFLKNIKFWIFPSFQLFWTKNFGLFYRKTFLGQLLDVWNDFEYTFGCFYGLCIFCRQMFLQSFLLPVNVFMQIRLQWVSIWHLW